MFYNSKSLSAIDFTSFASGFLIGVTSKMLFDIAKPHLKNYTVKLVSKSIDFYVDLKWKYLYTTTTPELSPTIATWKHKNEYFGVYKVNDKEYISFNLDKDLSKVIYDETNDTKIENIKLYTKDSVKNLMSDKSNKLQDIIISCGGPNLMFQGGVPTLKQLKLLDAFNSLDNITRIIINLSNYEEYIID
jgi:hypothetical protein